jgi:4a-hydroxytetrahydrobiopterin dehydratase
VPPESEASDLAQQRCVPCEGATAALTGDELRGYFAKLGDEWELAEEHHLEKEVRFVNFADALDFTNQVGAVAEAEGHHPDLLLGWGRVKIFLWTHAADGLTKNDFILAAKISRLTSQRESGIAVDFGT